MVHKTMKDRAFLKAISEIDGPASTKEISDSVGYTNDGCIKRLKDMRERGVIDSKKVGNTYIWYQVEQDNKLQSIYEQVDR